MLQIWVTSRKTLQHFFKGFGNIRSSVGLWAGRSVLKTWLRTFVNTVRRIGRALSHPLFQLQLPFALSNNWNPRVVSPHSHFQFIFVCCCSTLKSILRQLSCHCFFMQLGNSFFSRLLASGRGTLLRKDAVKKLKRKLHFSILKKHHLYG